MRKCRTVVPSQPAPFQPTVLLQVVAHALLLPFVTQDYSGMPTWHAKCAQLEQNAMEQAKLFVAQERLVLDPTINAKRARRTAGVMPLARHLLMPAFASQATFESRKQTALSNVHRVLLDTSAWIRSRLDAVQTVTSTSQHLIRA